MPHSFWIPNVQSEQPGPWGNSPEYIASWFWPHTDLKAIFESIAWEQNDENIARMNSLCITLWLPHRFSKDQEGLDIADFMDYLVKDTYRNDFSLRVSDILLSKVDEDTGKYLREFLERINLWMDDPGNVFFREKTQESFDLDKELQDIVWATIKTFGLVWWFYQIYLFFRILWML